MLLRPFQLAQRRHCSSTTAVPSTNRATALSAPPGPRQPQPCGWQRSSSPLPQRGQGSCPLPRANREMDTSRGPSRCRIRRSVPAPPWTRRWPPPTRPGPRLPPGEGGRRRLYLVGWRSPPSRRRSLRTMAGCWWRVMMMARSLGWACHHHYVRHHQLRTGSRIGWYAGCGCGPEDKAARHGSSEV